MKQVRENKYFFNHQGQSPRDRATSDSVQWGIGALDPMEWNAQMTIYLNARMRRSEEILPIVYDSTNDIIMGILRKDE